MTPFLEIVAENLIKKYGKDLSRFTVVFPNKRARLFMNEYLSRYGTIWAPRYTTISELFSSMADVSLNDPIDTVCRIHDIYRRITGSDETLDVFYGWGERLLADFDDVDKNLVDSQQLFTNVKDYKSIDFGDFLNEEERKAIQSFFLQFDEEQHSTLKENFQKLWNHMLPIYNELNRSLFSEGLAYEGALYRRCVEQIGSGMLELPSPEDVSKWIFVGFNVLDKVEHSLMTYLRDIGRAAFYWDYDIFYASETSPYEAGEFIRQNLLDFGNELAADIFSNMGKGQELEYVASPTENAQAFQAAEWIKENITADEKKTAIVLCNEEMLEPVLHALPQEVKEVNITKGFPLCHTNAFTQFLKKLNELERLQPELSIGDSLDVLLNFVETYAQEEDKALATLENNTQSRHLMLEELNAEACFRIITMLERLKALSVKIYFNVERPTLRRFIISIARNTSIPFHGEPATGLQIMGVLETRNLDFENILILSANEGMIPRLASDNSFIPYPLKAAYGLTLASKKTAVYAYYFFRLIQRAHRVRLVYNSTANVLQTGEMSRYMMQLLLSTSFNIKHFTLSAKVSSEVPRLLTAKKPQNLYELLTVRQNPDGTTEPTSLSPSALNKYLDCPLQFYFNRIIRIKKPQEEEQIDNRLFGNLFHDSAELFYADAMRFSGNELKAFLGQVLSEKGDKTLRDYIKKAYKNIKTDLRDVVAEETALSYLKKLLKADLQLGDLHIIGVETEMYLTIPVQVGNDSLPLRIGGRIDRLDTATNPNETNPQKARTLRIVDYKTGSHVHTAKDMVEVFKQPKRRPYYLLQMFLYALTVKERTKEICGEDIPVSTVLFYPSQYGREDYSPWVRFGNAPLHAFTDEHAEEFRKILTETLQELLDPTIPFKATDNEDACTYCDYRIICGRRETNKQQVK